MPVLEVKDFNLTYTLESGQMFRADRVGEWYYVSAREPGHDRLFKVKQDGDTLTFDGDVDEAFLKRYFALDHDLDAIAREIVMDDRMEQIFSKYRGLRILRQDPWECLISFLCSPANNIPKIKKTVASICEIFGQEARLDDYRSFTFPSPGKLTDLEALRAAKTGFRAEAIVAANSLMSDEYLATLAKLSYKEAKKKLMELPNVADKVADCVLLFSLGFLKAFPVDTWIKRAMSEFYFNNEKVSPSRIREFAQIYFGPYAGYAQQYLFYAVRQARAGQPEPEEEEEEEDE